MPRKRRQPKRRIDELTPALVELLILGDSEIDPFLEFDLSSRGDRRSVAAARDGTEGRKRHGAGSRNHGRCNIRQGDD